MLRPLLISLTTLPLLFVLVDRFSVWLNRRNFSDNLTDGLLILFGVGLYAASAGLAWWHPSQAAGWWAFGNEAVAFAGGLAGYRVVARYRVTREAHALIAAQADGVAVGSVVATGDADVDAMVAFAAHAIGRAAEMEGADRTSAYEAASYYSEAVAALLPADDVEGAGARIGAVLAASQAGRVERARALASHFLRDPALARANALRIEAALAMRAG